MIAEDHADSKEASKKLYECIRTKLLFASGDHKLPIIYVIDSILKNARGCYIGLFEDDAQTWMNSVYRALPDEDTRSKLKRVWNTWKDFSLFSTEKWKAIGACFEGSGNSGERSPRSSSPSGATLAAGIPRSVRQKRFNNTYKFESSLTLCMRAFFKYPAKWCSDSFRSVAKRDAKDFRRATKRH